MKIFCVGKNYVDHAKEMNSKVPESPLIFIKPETAYLRNESPFHYPAFSNDIHYEVELVLKIGRQGKNIQPEDVINYISKITLGVDFTARDIQSQCKKNGHPWELAKSFDDSALVGRFVEMPYEKIHSVDFKLDLNGQTVQNGNTRDMVFDIERIVSFISERFTIQMGDLIFTGTPAGVGSIKRGDLLEGFLDENLLVSTTIK